MSGNLTLYETILYLNIVRKTIFENILSFSNNSI